MKKISILFAALVSALTVMATDWSTTYTSNVELATTGTSVSECKVVVGGTEYAGLKAGTSSKKGVMVITVPAGTTKLYLHAAMWKGTSANATIAVTAGDVTLATIKPKANDGISNNSPFTFSGDASTEDYFFTVELTDVKENTGLTLTPSANRFVIFGVNTESETTPVNPDAPFIEAEDYDFGTLTLEDTIVKVNHTIPVSCGNLASGIKVSVLDVDGGPSQYFTADKDSLHYELDRVTITFAAKEPGEYTATLNLVSGNTYKNVQLTAVVEGPLTAISIAELQKIVPTTGKSDKFLLNDVVVTYVNGTSGLYVKDETGYLYIFNRSVVANVNSGDKLKGLVAVATYYNDLLEATDIYEFPQVEAGEAPAQPDVVNTPLTQSDISRYVKVEGVKFENGLTLTTTKSQGRGNIAINGDSIQLYNNFAIEASIEAGTYDVVGIVGIFRGTLQFQPINFTVSSVTPSAVEDIEVLDVKAPMYNVLGVKVDEEYKGVVIQNGKKYLR